MIDAGADVDARLDGDGMIPLQYAVASGSLEVMELRGDRAGLHSIRINDPWRVCFRWVDSDAYEVEIVDYHR